MKNKKAFTLIELLVVIAIIGLLATLAVIALNNARAKSRDSKRVADIKQVQTALELYFNDKGHYPSTNEFASGALDSTSTNGTTTYMAQIPTAPTPADGDCTSGHNDYVYSQLQNGNSYRITFCLGGQTGSVAAGYTMATPEGFSVFTSNIVCNDIEQECDASCPVGSTCGGGTLISISPNIIAAPSKNEETGCVGTQNCTGKEDSVPRVWGPSPDSQATSTTDGLANTAIIKANAGGNYSTYLPSYCENLSLFGFNDWYLPATNEVYAIYSAKISGFIGGFINANYWSSRSYGYYGDWGMYASFFVSGTNGGISLAAVNSPYYVRCVRRF